MNDNISNVMAYYYSARQEIIDLMRLGVGSMLSHTGQLAHQEGGGGGGGLFLHGKYSQTKINWPVS